MKEEEAVVEKEREVAGRAPILRDEMSVLMRGPGCEVCEADEASGAVAVVASGGALNATCWRGD